MPEFQGDGDVIVRIADRFALQQSWWLASEIARRHGALWISRVEDEEHYALLIVSNGPVGNRVQFDLPAGMLWQNSDGGFERRSWIEVFEAGNSDEFIKLLEAGAGFGVPERAAESNRMTIVYRLAAAILAAKIDDRHSWQIVSAPLVGDETVVMEALAALATFPSTGPQVEFAYSDIHELYVRSSEAGTSPYWHEPFWLVLRDLEPVMVLDEAGYAHLPDGVRIELLPLHRALGSSVQALAGVVLADPDAALAIALLLEGTQEGGL